MLKISEVFEKQTREVIEKPDGSEYIHFTKVFDARECLLNEKYIVSVMPHYFTSSGDLAKLEDRFAAGTKFSKFVVDGNSFRSSEIIVVGSFDKYCQLLETS